MIREIRFVGRGSTYDKTLAKFTYEGSWAEALRYAADCLDKSPLEEVEQVTGVRVRTVQVTADATG
jgi:hypothetical protein